MNNNFKNNSNTIFIFVTSQLGGLKFIEPLILYWLESGIKNFYLLINDEFNSFFTNFEINSRIYNEPSKLSLVLKSNKECNNIIFVSGATHPTSHLERLVYRYSNRNGIKLVQFIDNWYDIKNRLLKTNGINKYPNILILPDKTCEDNAIKSGVPKKIIKTLGHPAFEKFIHNRLHSKNIFLIVDQNLSEIDLDLGYNEFDFYKVVFDTFSHLKIDCSKIDVIVHPSRKKKLEKMLPPGINFIKGKVTEQYKYILGMFSSLLVEEFYYGSNVITVQPILCKDDPFPLSTQNLVPKFSNSKDLKNYLLRDKICLKNKRINPFCGSKINLSKFLLDYGATFENRLLTS